MEIKRINTFKCIFICLINIIIILSNISYCYGFSEIIGGGSNFIQAGIEDEKKNENTIMNEVELKEISNVTYNILLVLAIIIAVIVGMFIGIKFMMAGATEKANLKETLIPYIAGCIVIFGAFLIWKLVVTILTNATM